MPRMISFDELDATLQWFDAGYAISHDEAYRRFDEVYVEPPRDLPRDPFSAEYAARYMDIYRKIAGRHYSVQNELSCFDPDQVAFRPFPYFTKSTKIAAEHFGYVARLLEIIDVPQQADIVEFGFGWGHTTLALAMLGHRVTAIDIDAKYIEVVRRRAEANRVEGLQLINADFLWVETADRQFDAAIFFESFHHCWEFERLLAALHRVIRPGGKIYFAAEPIEHTFAVPWGVRLDGQSLLVARRYGWMELGFNHHFFAALLKRHGWQASCAHQRFWAATR